MYKDYYVLTGNKILGHFGTIRDSWTREDAIEMAAIDTSQPALERLYLEGADCVYHDDETGCYVFDSSECRILDFEPDEGALELCERIRNAREWDPVDTYTLCDLAELGDEWINATHENFEQVVYEAADILGGVIV